MKLRISSLAESFRISGTPEDAAMLTAVPVTKRCKRLPAVKRSHAYSDDPIADHYELSSNSSKRNESTLHNETKNDWRVAASSWSPPIIP